MVTTDATAGTACGRPAGWEPRPGLDMAGSGHLRQLPATHGLYGRQVGRQGSARLRRCRGGPKLPSMKLATLRTGPRAAADDVRHQGEEVVEVLGEPAAADAVQTLEPRVGGRCAVLRDAGDRHQPAGGRPMRPWGRCRRSGDDETRQHRGGSTMAGCSLRRPASALVTLLMMGCSGVSAVGDHRDAPAVTGAAGEHERAGSPAPGRARPAARPLRPEGHPAEPVEARAPASRPAPGSTRPARRPRHRRASGRSRRNADPEHLEDISYIMRGALIEPWLRWIGMA